MSDLAPRRAGGREKPGRGNALLAAMIPKAASRPVARCGMQLCGKDARRRRTRRYGARL